MLNRDNSWEKEGGAFNWRGCVEINGGFSANAEIDDIHESASHTKPMNDITREELDAKLQATEARMDARLERFDKDMRQAVSDFRLDIQPLKSLKANIWGATAVSIGVIVAVLSYGVASFDSGRDTAAVIQEMKQQSFETRQLLEQIKAQQVAKPTGAAAPTSPPSAP